MKTMLTLVFLCLLLCGCGKQEIPTTHFSVTRAQTIIALDAPAAPVLEALGAPFGYGEQRGTSRKGVEKTYRFSGLDVRTYQGKDGERILNLLITDDSLETPQGISVGDTAAQVRQCFGQDAIQGNRCTIQTASEKMVLLLENNLVASIQYSLL